VARLLTGYIDVSKSRKKDGDGEYGRRFGKTLAALRGATLAEGGFRVVDVRHHGDPRCVVMPGNGPLVQGAERFTGVDVYVEGTPTAAQIEGVYDVLPDCVATLRLCDVVVHAGDRMLLMRRDDAGAIAQPAVDRTTARLLAGFVDVGLTDGNDASDRRFDKVLAALRGAAIAGYPVVDVRHYGTPRCLVPPRRGPIAQGAARYTGVYVYVEGAPAAARIDGVYDVLPDCAVTLELLDVVALAGARVLLRRGEATAAVAPRATTDAPDAASHVAAAA
jgi:hypothetical protein